MKTIELTFPVWKSPSAKEVENIASKSNGGAVCAVTRRSLDARGEIVYRYRIEVYDGAEEYVPYKVDEYRDVSASDPVVVVGAGPAGMFAALRLLSLGYKPIILERGKDVHRRKRDMARLSLEGLVNPDSNYCYGEGGAGAFSDGKLFTRSSKRGDIRQVLYQLVRFGASPDIIIDAHPHIGSDKLPVIVENIRKCILEHGGEYHFDSRVTGISASTAGKRRLRVMLAGGDVYETDNVILATGHSARDVYEMLDRQGIRLEAKGFALGVRVEHPQYIINRARFHGKTWEGMPAAEYSFVEQVGGRGVFSFCMCPGGLLVPSSTEAGTVVLNGMSNSARNSRWANAGVVVQVEPGDVPAEYTQAGPFSLLNYQRDVERAMFQRSAHPLAAPAQRMTDFCRGRISSELPATSYFPGAVPAPLNAILPENVSSRLKKVFPVVDRSIHGYYTEDALLLGVESRTSSPVKICRDPESLQAYGMPGLYPCGEGAGYSGGIVSSAIDGIRCADALAESAF